MEDMFRSLPDEILGRIVSFLPNESAIYTSLVSRRWRDLWKEAIVRYGTVEETSDVVAEFIAHFQELDPLKHPRSLRFHYGEAEVLLAAIAANHKLLLDFSNRKKKEPEGLYELKLKLSVHNHIHNHLQFPTNFLIKTLYLKSVCASTSEPLSSTVSSLQNLESLIINGCDGLETLCIDFETKLKRLTIVDCVQLKNLHLRTCRLRFFRYRGFLPWIWPENHFNLVDAMLDFRVGPRCCNFKTQDFDAALLTIKNSEILTLCDWNVRALFWPSICPQSGSFIFYKLRELWWILKDAQSSDALVSFIKLCPALEQLFVTVDPDSYSTENRSSCLKHESKYTKLEHLRLIKLMGFTREEEEVSLARDLVQLVKGKPPKIEASDGSYFQILDGNSRKQSKNKSCEHVRQEKEMSYLCPKHPHMGFSRN